MVVYFNSPFLPYINILGSQGANFYVSCNIFPTPWIKPRARVTKYSKCLTSHVTRDIMMPQTVPLVCLWANQISCASNTLFFIKTDSHEIIYPVRTREEKNHTQSSGTSPYGPLSGVYPTGVKRTVMLQSAAETPQEHTHIMSYKWKKAVFLSLIKCNRNAGTMYFWH